MVNSNEKKRERNDIYTAFFVLTLFVVFGFLITRSTAINDEVETVWIEQPASPSGYQGYPFPHDDESIKHVKHLRVEERLTALPARKMMPVKSGELIAKPMSAIAPAGAAAIAAVVPERKIEIEAPSERVIEEVVVVEEEVVEVEPTVAAPVKVEPAPTPKPKPIVKKPKPVAKPAPKPQPVPNPVVSSNSGVNYITSDLPCVWIVGIFKNLSNVNRVVARLRLNKFDVATGLHEKGTYVGVPCECQKDDPKQAKLREIFSAQPWMLKK
jgi:cell division septation protein DedD